MLSGTRESVTGRRDNVVCGSVDLRRIKVGGSVVHSGGLILMETETSPGMGSGGVMRASGRRVVMGERR